MARDADSQFLDEVRGLFALEAQEWISQANLALTELEASDKPCPPDRALKLYDTIVRGVSNLGGSAATVSLTSVERLAFAALPVLQVMQALPAPPAGKQVQAVRGALEAILGAVKRVTRLKSGEIDDVDAIVAALDQARSVSGETADDSHEGGRGATVRNALLQFHETQIRNAETTRNIAEIILHRASGDSDSSFDDQVATKILKELELLDQQFLDEVKRRAPTITVGFNHLKPDGASTSAAKPPTPTRVVQEIDHLYEIARLVNSSPLMFYLQGLKSFLSVATERPALVSPQRFEAVSTRVALLPALAQRWVEVGRAERASIEKILQS